MQLERSLKSFYQAYWAWLEAGAPDDNEYNFTRGFGLCSNLNNYYSENDGYAADGRLGDTKQEMKDQFTKVGLNRDMPFNPNGDYFEESWYNGCHLNVRRIAWVKKHAEAE